MAAPPASADNKQQVLIDSIAAGVAARQAADLAQTRESYAKLQITMNAFLARFEVLEASLGAAKRPTRAGAAKSPAKKPVPKKGADGGAKVTNALLFARHMLAEDLDGARETYGTPENLAEAEKDATVAKRDREKEPVLYWSAVGAALWKSVFTEDQKEEIRSRFTAWKEQSVREEDPEPLGEDA